MRAVIVGCGKIAGGYNRRIDDLAVLTHALAYQRHPDFRIAACVDPDASVRAAFAQQWAIPSAYESLSSALATEHYDIASVCSPTGTHLDALEMLLASDVRRVFVEKPLDGNGARARPLAERYVTAGRALAINFTRRWDVEMQRVRAEIAAGAWGELGSAVGWYGRGILNNGSHMLNLVAFLTGRTMTVDTVGKFSDDGMVGDATVDAVLDLDGVPFHLVGSDNRAYARFELTLSFTGGVIEVLEGGLFLRERKVQKSHFFADVYVAGEGVRTATGYGTAMLRALDEFRDWQPGKTMTSDANSAILSVEIAMDISQRTGVAA
jgi:predicted dehydrogenase